MKKVLFIFLIFVLSCSSKDISKVKVGMNSVQVIELAGEPISKMKMFNAEFYYYDNNVVVIEKDTVKSIKTIEEFDKALENL